MDKKERLKLFFKGLLIGIAQTIPGISGGTIAFITGIYERLIGSIDAIDLNILLYIIKGNFGKAKESIKDIDYSFFIPLGIGVTVSMITVANLMVFAINQWKGLTFSFFFGLIFASAIKIFLKVSQYSLKNSMLGLIGFFVTFFFSGINQTFNLQGLHLLFISGFIAVLALMLPGISGSLLLLIMGQYETVMNIISNFHSNITEIVVFISGGLVSLFSIVKLLSFLFDRFEQSTISFLTGLVFGSLRLPYIEIINIVHTGLNPYLMFLSAITGAGLVYFLENTYSV